MQSTHPIEVAVNHPDEINEIFDLISYNKGASVLRMLFNFISEEKAFQSLKVYLERFANKNTVTNDLWQAMSEVSGFNIAELMQAWTSKPGFPYLRIMEDSGKLSVSSSRFIAPWSANTSAWPSKECFASGASFDEFLRSSALLATPETSAQHNDWNIPVSVVVEKNHDHKLGILHLDGCTAQERAAKLSEFSTSLSSAVSGSSWFTLNSEHAAFFRTIYSDAMISRAKAAIATPADRQTEPVLGINDRIGLIGDVAASVSIGATKTSVLLELLWSTRFETYYTVWVAILEAVSDVKTALEGSGELRTAMDLFLQRLLTPITDFLGWEPKDGEDPNAPLLRASVLRVSAMCGVKSVIEECLNRFDKYVGSKKTPIAGDLKQVVYNTAAQFGGAERWNALFELFSVPGISSEEERRLMTALGKTEDPELLRRTLGLALTDMVRGQDLPFLLAGVATNPSLGRDAAFEFFTANFSALKDKLGESNFVWAGVVGACTSNFDMKEAADRIEDFFKDKNPGSAARKIKQNLESIRCKAWRVHILMNEHINFNF
jgi:aminopeptidase N